MSKRSNEQDFCPPELEDMAEEVGEFICYWGFKKIHGRIWTHIYLSKTPLDAGQLMVRLKVSKALVSLSLNDLLKYEVIKEGEKSARGTQTYFSNPDVLNVILNVLRHRERKMIAKTEVGHKMLASLKPETLSRANLNTDRITALGVMIEQAQNALVSLLELAPLDLNSWQKINETKRSV